MNTDNAQNELVVNNMTRVLILSGIQYVIDEKRALTSSDPRSKKYLEHDIDELNKIIEFIGNKKFSIVLNERWSHSVTAHSNDLKQKQTHTQKEQP